jgi:hypothetical protein
MLALHHHAQQAAAAATPMTLEAKAISTAIVVVVLALALAIWRALPGGPSVGRRRQRRQTGRGHRNDYDSRH